MVTESELETMEILDSHNIAGYEYVAVVITNDTFPNLLTSYNDGLEEPCPRCGYTNTCCISPKEEPHGWYCLDCLTMWEWRLLT